MSRTRTIGLTAAAMMACASAASAGTVTQTITVGPLATGSPFTFSFAGFNPALGTLTKVSDTMTEALSGTINVTNAGPSSATFSAHLTNSAMKTFTGLLITSTTTSTTASGMLAAGASSGPKPVSGLGSGSNTTTSGLAAFEGATVTATAMDLGALTLRSDTGNATAAFTDDGTITDVLVYTFSPITHIPEPGALVLLGGALTFLGVTRRRKRKA